MTVSKANKLTPGLMNRTSKFPKNLKFSKDSKLTPEVPELPFFPRDDSETMNLVHEPVVTLNEYNSVSTESSIVTKQPVRPHLKRVREKVLLKERKYIRFFYRGSTKIAEGKLIKIC